MHKKSNLQKGSQSNVRVPSKAMEMKEEISMELAEIGNMMPKQEPMTPNARDKSEKEKWHG